VRTTINFLHTTRDRQPDRYSPKSLPPARSGHPAARCLFFALCLLPAGCTAPTPAARYDPEEEAILLHARDPQAAAELLVMLRAARALHMLDTPIAE